MKSRQIGDAAERLFQKAVSAQVAGAFADAERLYRLAIGVDPSRSGPKHNLGVLLRGLGRLEEARALLAGVLAREPGLTATRYQLGLVQMGMGDYPGGWPLYESRRDLPELKVVTPALPFPEWTGQDLAGKRIVLFPEQGLGDNIQFARFALALRDRGASVLMLCRPPLTQILRSHLDGVEVQAAEGKVEMGEPDYWALTGSLPGLMQTTPNTLPDGAFIRLPARPPGSGVLRIGLATHGNPTHQNDARRSLKPAAAKSLAAILAQQGEVLSLHREQAGDFVSTANLIAGLDVVVSVDTSIGHLAGAMGRPTFLLIPGFGADWRWLSDRDDTPWYPNHRLFRSTVEGDWAPALEAIASRLRQ